VRDAPARALARPPFVGAVAAVSVLGGGPSTLLADEPARGGDPLTLALPALGGGVPAARLAAVDVVFVGALAGYAESRRLGVVAAGAGMLAGLCAALVLDAAAGVSAPALALMAAGFLVACAGRLPGVARPAARRR
jgi:hypothetical protein